MKCYCRLNSASVCHACLDRTIKNFHLNYTQTLWSRPSPIPLPSPRRSSQPQSRSQGQSRPAEIPSRSSGPATQPNSSYRTAPTTRRGPPQRQAAFPKSLNSHSPSTRPAPRTLRARTWSPWSRASRTLPSRKPRAAPGIFLKTSTKICDSLKLMTPPSPSNLKTRAKKPKYWLSSP